MKTLFSSVYTSPIGGITIVQDEDSLCYLDFAENNERLYRLLSTRFGAYQLLPKEMPDIMRRMSHYFQGDWLAFEGIQLSMGGTEFQRNVWNELMNIPAGATISYQTLAETIRKPKAIRAAASSNARNPIAIIVPCHRVIGKDGALRGYAGGMHRKQWLLAHEGVSF